MMEINEEQLTAWIGGLLNEKDSAEVEAYINSNPEAAAFVDEQRSFTASPYFASLKDSFLRKQSRVIVVFNFEGLLLAAVEGEEVKPVTAAGFLQGIISDSDHQNIEIDIADIVKKFVLSCKDEENAFHFNKDGVEAVTIHDCDYTEEILLESEGEVYRLTGIGESVQPFSLRIDGKEHNFRLERHRTVNDDNLRVFKKALLNALFHGRISVFRKALLKLPQQDRDVFQAVENVLIAYLMYPFLYRGTFGRGITRDEFSESREYEVDADSLKDLQKQYPELAGAFIGQAVVSGRKFIDTTRSMQTVFCEKVLSLLERFPDDLPVSLPHMIRGWAFVVLGRRKDALDAFTRAAGIAEETGQKSVADRIRADAQIIASLDRVDFQEIRSLPPEVMRSLSMLFGGGFVNG